MVEVLAVGAESGVVGDVEGHEHFEVFGPVGGCRNDGKGPRVQVEDDLGVFGRQPLYVLPVPVGEYVASYVEAYGHSAAELHDELRPVCQPLVTQSYQVDVVDVLPQEVLRAVAGRVYVVADRPPALRPPAKCGVRTGEDGRQIEAPDVARLPVALRIRHPGDNPRETAGYRLRDPSLETYEHFKLGLAPRRRVGALPVKPPS